MNETNSQADPRAAEPVLDTPSRKLPMSRWQRVKFFIRAVEVRVRFIALFVVIGLVMAYWTTLEAYWDRWTRPATAAAADAADTEYYCPMHPTVVRPGLEPNGAVPNCPICGMPLSKRKKGEAPKLPEGVLARVQLSPHRVQLAGVETVEATYMPLVKEIRTVGYVGYDESRLAEIVARVSGYVESLHVDKTFASVDEGQPLAEVYSPDLYSGVQELLLAQKHGAGDLLASARRRLKLLGVDDAEIDQALEANDPASRLLIRSPLAGQVIEKNVTQGASIEQGAVLFKVADLSTVWIEADVFERDLPLISQGQQIEAVVDAASDRTFSGEVSVIYPEVNAQSRTGRIRVTVDNPELALRPGMFASVLIQTPVSRLEPFASAIASARQDPKSLSDEELIERQQFCPVTGLKLGAMGNPLKVTVNDRPVFICCASCETPLVEDSRQYLAKLAPPPEDAVLSVPEQAVIDTGRRKVVYVERAPGVFDGVEVELGPRAGSYYPVISGLAAGDKVAAAGSFLLDAETRLNPSAAAAYFGASGGGSSDDRSATQAAAAGRTATGDDDDAPLTDAQLKQLEKLPEEDRALATAQRLCPVTGEPLGSMGVPVKVTIDGEPVFLCCKSCERQARQQPAQTLEKVRALRGPVDRAAGDAATAAEHGVHQH
ncbi:MAG: RND transporter [Planctomycetota bacterium]|nr:MAG: RND transporter [Planctomycetota bacterium]